MNKPEKFKILTEVNDSYCKNLLEIFDKDYNNNHDTLYNRPTYFKKVQCNFVVDSFKVKNKIKFKKFIESSADLLRLLNDLYGPGKFLNIQVAKMQGGGVILPHIDLGLGFVLSHRIHIPLITNKNVIFTIQNEEFYFPSGYVYEINNLKEHSVLNKNNPNYNRTHVIFDYISDEYISFLASEKKSISFTYQ